jgi:hypothetical protein
MIIYNYNPVFVLLIYDKCNLVNIKQSFVT